MEVVVPFDIRCVVAAALLHNKAPEVVGHALYHTEQVMVHEQALVLRHCQRTPSLPMRAMGCLLASQSSRSCLQAWELAGVLKKQVVADRCCHRLEVVDWRQEEARKGLLQQAEAHPRVFD